MRRVLLFVLAGAGGAVAGAVLFSGTAYARTPAAAHRAAVPAPGAGVLPTPSPAPPALALPARVPVSLPVPNPVPVPVPPPVNPQPVVTVVTRTVEHVRAALPMPSVPHTSAPHATEALRSAHSVQHAQHHARTVVGVSVAVSTPHPSDVAARSRHRKVAPASTDTRRPRPRRRAGGPDVPVAPSTGSSGDGAHTSANAPVALVNTEALRASAGWRRAAQAVARPSSSAPHVDVARPG